MEANEVKNAELAEILRVFNTYRDRLRADVRQGGSAYHVVRRYGEMSRLVGEMWAYGAEGGIAAVQCSRVVDGLLSVVVSYTKLMANQEE